LRVPNNTTLRGHGARITLARKLRVNDQDMLVTNIAEQGVDLLGMAKALPSLDVPENRIRR
jgi:DNA-binding transcriptional MocR family regulator